MTVQEFLQACKILLRIPRCHISLIFLWVADPLNMKRDAFVTCDAAPRFTAECFSDWDRALSRAVREN